MKGEDKAVQQEAGGQGFCPDPVSVGFLIKKNNTLLKILKKQSQRLILF